MGEISCYFFSGKYPVIEHMEFINRDRFYLKAARASEKVEKIVKYLSVLALLGHEQLNYWPSTVAAGLVILASIATNQDASYENLIEVDLPYVAFSTLSVLHCVKLLGSCFSFSIIMCVPETYSNI